MESNFIIKILYQIDLNKKIASIRKTKKIYFHDPFLFWVFQGYVNGLSDYFAGSKKRIGDNTFKGKLIENLVMNHLMRLENRTTWSNKVFFFRTTNQAEVDFVIKLSENKIIPIEVKYKDTVTEKDFIHLDKIDKKTGYLISKDTLQRVDERWIIPVEVFLLIDKW